MGYGFELWYRVRDETLKCCEFQLPHKVFPFSGNLEKTASSLKNSL
ncbi:hypothetical protein GXM_09063 [Nostoc sphaeroides CCNUC1]|uniref:Uncharacterized protein n=1 Tax=Nostoc sphaeroides CCNUC1 TaxID=2653204 RepID=A0A5P8WIC7_9NOSO|nr:hypothetical protein GXM_09063 [Nostoc sphaeroides CCNUC1]